MLSWIASCCHGRPKKGPMGEVAGVTSCRPAMLQRGGGEGAGLLQVSTLSHFIILFSQKFTDREDEDTVLKYSSQHMTTVRFQLTVGLPLDREFLACLGLENSFFRASE